jgi:hypothetical protein
MFILSVAEGLGMTVKIYKTEFLKLALMGAGRGLSFAQVRGIKIRPRRCYVTSPGRQLK